MLANYEHFHNPAVTDEAKFREESEWRFAHGGWTSVLHYHRHLEKCEGKCKLYSAHQHRVDCKPDCDISGEWTLLEAPPEVSSV